MELINKLKSLFNTDSIVELKINNEYNFSINWIKATKERPHHIIFTSGLSHLKQIGSEKYPEFESIELYLCLPEYWKVQDSSSDYQWPIEWLNRIAQVPQKNSTWFGPGDTIPAGNPANSISSKLKQNHFILTEPIKFESELKVINLDSKDIRFLSIVPIFEDELKFKVKNSSKILLEKYKHNKFTEEIDEYRTPVVRNSKYNMFTIAIIGICLAVGLTLVFKILL
jgi:hypothetical protein